MKKWFLHDVPPLTVFIATGYKDEVEIGAVSFPKSVSCVSHCHRGRHSLSEPLLSALTPYRHRLSKQHNSDQETCRNVKPHPKADQSRCFQAYQIQWAQILLGSRNTAETTDFSLNESASEPWFAVTSRLMAIFKLAQSFFKKLNNRWNGCVRWKYLPVVAELSQSLAVPVSFRALISLAWLSECTLCSHQPCFRPPHAAVSTRKAPIYPTQTTWLSPSEKLSENMCSNAFREISLRS